MSDQKKFTSSHPLDRKILFGLVFIMLSWSLSAAPGLGASNHARASDITTADTTLAQNNASQYASGLQFALQGSAEPGQALFEEMCIACHTIGSGTLVGPDLEGVTERRDRDWLLEWIQRPDEVLARGDPIATELLQEFNNVPMPNLGLSEAQAADILAYLENPGGESQVAAPEGGVAGEGKAIFTGSTSLTNGGPPCMSCHTTTGVGELGGGTLGPDLTNVYQRFGEGLSAALEGLPFPTMQAVFADNPLTEAEVADLYAYFVQADQKSSQPISFYFVWIGLAGFFVITLMIELNWRKRLTGVRKPLLGGSK